MSDALRKYVVVRFAHGGYEWMAEHAWESHKRLVPNTKGEAVSEPIAIQDAINFVRLVNDTTQGDQT